MHITNNNTDHDTPKYEQYEGLIMKHALSFHRTTGLPIDDLMSEGRLLFMKARAKWCPSRGKFSTVLVWYLRTEMINWAKVEQRRSAEIPTDPFTLDVFGEDITLREVLFNDALRSLSSDAQAVARVIFRIPEDLVAAIDVDGEKTLLTHVSRWLRGHGWRDARITRAYNELALLANSL